MLRDIQLAASFLTALPFLDRSGHDQKRNLAKALRFAPLIGLAIAMPQAAIAGILLALEAPPLVLGLATVALACWLTRALHEDGLADYADGLGGGWTRERRLEIMRDSRIGAFGAIALILTIGLRVTAIASISAQGYWPLAVAFMAAATLSRTSFAIMLWRLQPARIDGLSKDAGSVSAGDVAATLALPLVLLVAFVHPVISTTVLLAWAAVTGFSLNQAKRHLGGHTGDVAGALQQVGEVTILSVLGLGIWL